MSLADIERAWRRAVFGDGHGLVDVEPARQQLYRDLVRNNLGGVLRRACPHAARLAGSTFDDIVTAFLTEPLRERFTRRIPQAFTTWLSSTSMTLPHASFAELCHFEALEIDVVLAERAPHVVTVLRDDAVAVLDASARLGVYAHPVHLVTATTTTWPTPSSVPTALLMFQHDEVAAVEVLPLLVARLLVALGGGARIGT
ncbi:MAG TPA: putative DNA-binding domain-containing protein, partial [Myxococcota bacterium]